MAGRSDSSELELGCTACHAKGRVLCGCSWDDAEWWPASPATAQQRQARAIEITSDDFPELVDIIAGPSLPVGMPALGDTARGIVKDSARGRRIEEIVEYAAGQACQLNGWEVVQSGIYDKYRVMIPPRLHVARTQRAEIRVEFSTMPARPTPPLVEWRDHDDA